MFLFIVLLLIGVIGFIFVFMYLTTPDSWPFNPNRRELNKADITMIKIRGIVLIALGIIMTLASIRQLFI